MQFASTLAIFVEQAKPTKNVDIFSQTIAIFCWLFYSSGSLSLSVYCTFIFFFINIFPQCLNSWLCSGKTSAELLICFLLLCNCLIQLNFLLIFLFLFLQYPEPNRPWPGGSSPAPSPGPGSHPLPPASPHHAQHGGPPPSSSPSHAPSPSPQPSQASPSPHQVSEELLNFDVKNKCKNYCVLARSQFYQITISNKD